MAKVGKLTKLRSAIKRWPSFTNKLNIGRTGSSSNMMSVAAVNDDVADHHDRGTINEQEVQAVYVGKSRRRYLVRSDVVGHPLFQDLVDKTAADNHGGIVVPCEIVLFEHLLWMLENAAAQLGSTDDLVDFYTC